VSPSSKNPKAGDDIQVSPLAPELPQTMSYRIDICQDVEARQRLAFRAHDLTSALRALNFAVDALKKGYRFEDEKAAAKIAVLEKAVQTLSEETALVLRLLHP
jgi:hypothetical protein